MAGVRLNQDISGLQLSLSQPGYTAAESSAQQTWSTAERADTSTVQGQMKAGGQDIPASEAAGQITESSCWLPLVI